jgi:hypothetical protein
MEHWFVYYKVSAAQAAALAPRLHDMIEELGSANRVHGRLLRRADERGDQVTLMETYDGIVEPAAFGAALDGAVVRAGLPSDLVAARRIERFCAC